MFLLNAAVSVLFLLLLLNFLYSPIESMENGKLYKTCDECLKSHCHKEKHRPCNTRYIKRGEDEYNYICFECPPEFGNDQFYSEDECKKGCTDPSKHCVCDFACFMCVAKVGFTAVNFTECTPKEEETCV